MGGPVSWSGRLPRGVDGLMIRVELLVTLWVETDRRSVSTFIFLF